MEKNRKKNQKVSQQQSRGMFFKLLFWVVGIIAVALVVFMVVNNQEKKSNTVAATSIDYKGQAVLGDASAKVQILEFGDYKCPYCKDFTTSLFPSIKKDFIDTGKVQFYFMNDDFINVDSTRAAEFAEVVYQELGNDKYWEFHELLYSKQPDEQEYEKKDYFTEEFLTNMLKEIASTEEVEKVVTSFQAGNGEAPLEIDRSYVEKLKVTSTPTLFINGKQFTGSTYEDLKKMIHDALKE